MRLVKVKVNGRVVEAILITNVKEKKRKRTIRGKKYEWVEYYAWVYIPKGWSNKKLILLGLD